MGWCLIESWLYQKDIGLGWGYRGILLCASGVWIIGGFKSGLLMLRWFCFVLCSSWIEVREGGHVSIMRSRSVGFSLFVNEGFLGGLSTKVTLVSIDGGVWKGCELGKLEILGWDEEVYTLTQDLS